MRNHGWPLVLGAMMVLSLQGCMTDATTELTRAPFNATSDLTNGTSAAIGDILQPTTDFTSSTTPGATYSEAIARARKKTELFAAHSTENLRLDIARGSGEYLVSLGSLAGVPDDQLPEFQVHMRNSYAVMFSEPLDQPDTTFRVVEAAWAKGYGRQ